MSYSNYLRLTFLTPLFILGCGGSGEELTIDSSLINGISDPLVPYQWYLNNTGNDVFSSVKPTPGVDLNVASAWSQGITGQGVIVNVVDTGLEIAHPDLAANITTGSYNFDDSSSDPTNTINSDGDHGTSVAGLIAMVGNNGIGGKGVAYNAKLMGYNFIKDKSPQSVENLAKSFGGSASDASAKAHVFNASWGVSTCSLGPVSSGFMVDQSLTTVKSLRNGKGGLIVKSSGNGFFHQKNCGFSKIPGVSSANAAFDNTNTLDHLILVAAVNANGKKSSYSTTGANIWVSGFGGENGLNEKNAKSTSPSAYEPAMLTTDQSGCNKGYHAKYSTSLNPFEQNDSTVHNSLNPKCNFTSIFNGTSSAAPTVSGVVALMLQANPGLTWRDVKHILASTARVVDPNMAAISTPSGSSFLPDQIVEQSWVTNSAGYHFHNWFGFGLVDAGKAVAKAKSHINLTSELSKELKAFNFIDRSANFSMGPLTTETVSLSLNSNGLTFNECSQIEITSPKGTKSILINGGSGLASAQGTIRLLTNAFYGENANGDWRVEMKNICTASNQFSLQSANPTLTIRGR